MLFGLLLLLFGSPDEGLGPQASLYRELLFIVYAITLYKKQTKNKLAVIASLTEVKAEFNRYV